MCNLIESYTNRLETFVQVLVDLSDNGQETGSPLYLWQDTRISKIYRDREKKLNKCKKLIKRAYDYEFDGLCWKIQLR